LNLPNFITLTRIGCVPLFLWILSSPGLHALRGHQVLAAVAVFLLASGSDGVDGLVARLSRKVTTLGSLLSPLAEKLLVSSAYIGLVRFAPELVPAWIVVLIIGREFLVSGLRAVAEQQKLGLGVGELGREKTVLQTASIVALLLAHGWPRWQLGSLLLPGAAIATGVLWLMLALSMISAMICFRAFWMEALEESRRVALPIAGEARRP
jgi:CDP-diacylglycerol--glycerol-3-phosphate 3-phosphatidyltransferase